jgi:hypothetical protein
LVSNINANHTLRTEILLVKKTIMVNLSNLRLQSVINYGLGGYLCYIMVAACFGFIMPSSDHFWQCTIATCYENPSDHKTFTIYQPFHDFSYKKYLLILLLPVQLWENGKYCSNHYFITQTGCWSSSFQRCYDYSSMTWR